MRPSRIVPPVALGLALLLAGVRWSLRPEPDPAIGRPFPHLALAALPGVVPLTDATLRRGQPTVVNLFASWCVPCGAEAPQLAALRARGIAVGGIAVHDTPADSVGFLARTGTRFDAAALDPKGSVQGTLGTAGIPETWLVDGGGIVRARVRGALQPEDVTRLAGSSRF